MVLVSQAFQVDDIHITPILSFNKDGNMFLSVLSAYYMTTQYQAQLLIPRISSQYQGYLLSIKHSYSVPSIPNQY